jgi:hypothetical protein
MREMAHMNSSSILVNSLGAMIIASCPIASLIQRNSSLRRQPLPELLLVGKEYSPIIFTISEKVTLTFQLLEGVY